MKQAEAFQFVLGYVEDVDVEGNRVYITDSFGRKHNVPIYPRRGGGPIPRVSEQWVLDRSMGELAFHSMLTSNPPDVGDLNDLIAALEEMGFIESPGSVPDWEPGMMMQFAGSSAPDFWLLCDGSEISRDTYANLFVAIGETYGNGDGSTTFNLPDLRQRFPVGAQAGGDYDLGDIGGAETVALTEAEMPSHTHSGPSHTHSMGTHIHTMGTHVHAQGSHIHTMNNHSHGSGTLANDGDTHSHSFNAAFEPVVGTPFEYAETGSDPGSGRGSLGTAGDSHSHNITGSTQSVNPGNTKTTDPGNTSATDPGNTNATDPGDTNAAGTGATGSAGSGQAHENRPPFLALNYIIFTGVV